jgi:hypothetical protein
MLKYIIIAVVCFSFSFANVLGKGDTISPFELRDQFDKKHEINSVDYEIILFSADRDISKMVNEYLENQTSGFLYQNKAAFISDIHKMPSFITKMFALPKMKKYNYTMLLMYEENNSFPKKEDHLTIIKIKDGKIDSIEFVKSLEKVFK